MPNRNESTGRGFLIAGSIVVGSAGILSALYFANRARITSMIAGHSAVQLAAPSGAGTGQSLVVTPLPTLGVKLTKYYPVADSAPATVKQMEGGDEGAAVWRGKKAVDLTTGKRPVLYTLEQYLAGKAPYVSLSGDPEIWPFGQRIELDAYPGAVFRVVDTGGNFHGAGKLVRIVGREPLDVRVISKSSKLPDSATATIYIGDSFDPNGALAIAKAGKPTAVVGIVDAHTAEDHEALARMIASECPEQPVDVQKAAAWAARNRAALQGISITDLLAPEEYGPQDPSKGRSFASTRSPATDASRKVASDVLDALSGSDPTKGATDFWIPSQQDEFKMRGLSDPRYAGYRQGSGEIRKWLQKQGLVVKAKIGAFEFLGPT